MTGNCPRGGDHVYTVDKDEDEGGPGGADALYCLKCGVEIFDDAGYRYVRGHRTPSAADARLLADLARAGDTAPEPKPYSQTIAGAVERTVREAQYRAEARAILTRLREAEPLDR